MEFDDNNPFSESFQERERKERLREQQERQRIQLMQEVDRQRALQQRLELEQHGLMGSELSSRPPAPRLPFYSSDLPHDFVPPPRPLPPSPQHQSMQQASLSSPPAPGFLQTNERRPTGPPSFVPESPSIPGGSPSFHPVKQVHTGLPGPGFQPSPARPPFAPALPTAPPAASSGLPGSQDPAITQGQSYPGSAQSLIQLYSDIIPEEKGKKKRTRKKKKDEDAESAKAPSTPHSDVTAPPTPSIPEATSSTPAAPVPGEPPQLVGPEAAEPAGLSPPGVAADPPCAEPEAQPAGGDFAQGNPDQQTYAESEAEKLSVETPAQEAKLETPELEQGLGQGAPEAEQLPRDQAEEQAAAAATCPAHSPPRTAGAPATKGDSGNELLKHLLKNKKASSLLNQKPEGGSEEDSTKDSKLVERQNPADVVSVAQENHSALCPLLLTLRLQQISASLS